MFPLKESGRWWNCHKLIKAVSDSYSEQLVMPDRMVAVAYSGSEAYKGLGKRKGEMMEEEEMGKKMKVGEEVEVEHLTGENEGTATITLNRGRARNALNRQMVCKLRRILGDLGKNSGLKAVVIKSGASGIFCAGADLKERIGMEEEEVMEFLGDLKAVVTSLEELPVPVVAALDGAALGGGLELALGCDLRVAAQGVPLGLPEVLLGVIPGCGGTQRLARLVGVGRAAQIVYTGRPVLAQEAERWGLVNYCVEQNQNGCAAYAHALDVARSMHATAPAALGMAKVALREGARMSRLEEGLEVEEACYQALLHTRDRREGLEAFLAKRKPVFLGK